MSNLKNLKKGVATKTARSSVFNVDAGAGTKETSVILVPREPITITRAWVIPDVATIASGGSSATAKIGTAVDGEQIVAATALAESAVGVEQALTIVSGAVAAGTPVIAQNVGVAATVAGNYFVQIEYTGND
jgi:hypothetical protein